MPIDPAAGEVQDDIGRRENETEGQVQKARLPPSLGLPLQNDDRRNRAGPGQKRNGQGGHGHIVLDAPGLLFSRRQFRLGLAGHEHVKCNHEEQNPPGNLKRMDRDSKIGKNQNTGHRKKRSTTAVTRQATFTIRSRCARESPGVIPRKIGTVESGSMITKRKMNA